MGAREERTLKYEKKNIKHDALWSDEEPESQEERTLVYEKKNILHDGLWSDDEVAMMRDPEPQPGVELVEMDSEIHRGGRAGGHQLLVLPRWRCSGYRCNVA